MKTLCWKYTQFSQFNASDTLLLVSGVHFGVRSSTSGEIAVFSLAEELKLRCRIVNRPYDIFGAWFSDRYLLSGDLNWLQHLISSSVIWINKASQEITSENTPIMNRLFKFYNRNASSVRSIMVANCPWLNDPAVMEAAESERPKRDRQPIDLSHIESAFELDEYAFHGNPISAAVSAVEEAAAPTEDSYGAEQYWGDHYYASTFQYSEEFRRKFSSGVSESSDEWTEEEIEIEIDVLESTPSSGTDKVSKKSTEKTTSPKKLVNLQSTSSSTSPSKSKEEDEETIEDDLENAPPKYLIFSTGSKAYVPHQIAFKRIDKVAFPKHLDPGPSLKERIAMRAQRRESDNNFDEPDWSNYNEVADRFDKIDKVCLCFCSFKIF